MHVTKSLPSSSVNDNLEALKTLIRSIVAFFAAVVGFGLKHLLEPRVGNGMDAVEFNSNRWLCFIITGLFAVRVLAGASAHMIREYASSDRDEGKIRHRLTVDIIWLLTFGLFILIESYASNLGQFIARSVQASVVTLASSLFLVFRNTRSPGRWEFFPVHNLLYVFVLCLSGYLYYQFPLLNLLGYRSAILFLLIAGVIVAVADLYRQIKTLTDITPSVHVTSADQPPTDPSRQPR